MKKVINWLKNIRPVKILTVCVAVTFLLMTQACNRPGIAQQPPQPSGQPPNVERYDPTQIYELNTPEGGMNNFSDVDPRAKAAERAANARAAELARNARRNVELKGVDSSEQYIRNYQEGTPLDERVRRLGEDIGSSAEELGKGVIKGTQRGVENLEKSSERTAEDLTTNVQRGAEDTTKSLQRQAEDAADAVKRRIREIDID